MGSAYSGSIHLANAPGGRKPISCQKTNALTKWGISALVAVPAFFTSAHAISITFNYDYDSLGFYTPEKRNILGLATQNFSSLQLQREEIRATGSDYWNWWIRDIVIVDPVAPADEVTIYMLAEETDPTNLGWGSSMGIEADGGEDWRITLDGLNTNAAYKPVAGYIIVNSSRTDWYAGASPEVPSGQYDLLTLASHEIGHVLGFGLYGYAEAWTSSVNTADNTFTGIYSTGLYGEGVPLTSPDYVHVSENTTFGGNRFIMEPYVPNGTRVEWNPVELAMLRDLGYTAIPEPSTALLLFAGLAILSRLRRGRGFGNYVIS